MSTPTSICHDAPRPVRAALTRMRNIKRVGPSPINPAGLDTRPAITQTISAPPSRATDTARHHGNTTDATSPWQRHRRHRHTASPRQRHVTMVASQMPQTRRITTATPCHHGNATNMLRHHGNTTDATSPWQCHRRHGHATSPWQRHRHAMSAW